MMARASSTSFDRCFASVRPPRYADARLLTTAVSDAEDVVGFGQND